MFERNVYCLLGLPFDAVSMSQTIEKIRDAARYRRTCFFSTPNVNFLVACRTDEQFRDSVICSDLSVVDGLPLVWIARILCMPIYDRVAGSDLFQSFRDYCEPPLSIFFFGGADGVAEKACRRLAMENKGLRCAGFESPGFGSIEEMSAEKIIQRINASKADFLVVSLGARKGQAWIQRNLAQLSVPVVSHLGAVVDFVAGTIKRAPAWMQSAGFEWLWRIKEDHALWRRYFWDGLYLLALLMTRVFPYFLFLACHKFDKSQLSSATIETNDIGDDINVRLHGAWTEANISPLRKCFSSLVLAKKNLRLEMECVSYIDSAFLGLVLLLYGQQKRNGRTLILVSPRAQVRQVIRYCCAEYLEIVPSA